MGFSKLTTREWQFGDFKCIELHSVFFKGSEFLLLLSCIFKSLSGTAASSTTECLSLLTLCFPTKWYSVLVFPTVSLIWLASVPWGVSKLVSVPWSTRMVVLGSSGV